MADGDLTSPSLAPASHRPRRGAGRRGEAGEAAPRSEAILALARQAFIEKGFDGASMQDLARAASMSAGNFYRYFPSKAALIEAMIDSEVAQIEADFESVVASPDPRAALQAGLRDHMLSGCKGDDALWGEITAAAARKPEIAASLDRIEASVTHRIAEVLGHIQGLPKDEAIRRFLTHADVVFTIVHGVVTRPPFDPVRDAGLIALIERTIDWVLDDALTGRKDASA